MAWVSQVTVDTSAQVKAGWCLSLAETAVSAPHLFATAKEAADNADLHADRDYPTDAVCALFWDWTSKSDGINYGHVVINVPGQGLFSSPKQWGEFGNAWYSSIDEVSNWLGATYLGWSPTLAGTVLSVDDGGTAAPAAPAVASNQRVAGALGVFRRAEPNQTSEHLDGDLEAGTVGNFVGWVHGENRNGNDVWFQGVSGNWFWSGAFTDAGTDGIADLNPAPAAAVVIDAPPVVEAPVVADIAPATPVEAPVVPTPTDVPAEPVAPPVVKPVIPAPTKDEILTAINDTAATAAETAKVSNLTLLSKEFWVYSLERIIKSAAYSANALLIANGAGLLQTDWVGVLSVSGLAAASSLLVALSSFKDI